MATLKLKPRVQRAGENYHAIALWGRRLGSYAYYIHAEQAKAEEMGAPNDALYERDGKWVTVRDLKPDHPFHHAYATYLEALETGISQPY